MSTSCYSECRTATLANPDVTSVDSKTLASYTCTARARVLLLNLDASDLFPSVTLSVCVVPARALNSYRSARPPVVTSANNHYNATNLVVAA